MSKPGTKVSPPSSASRDFISRRLIIGCLAALILVEFGCAFIADISEVPSTHVAASNMVSAIEDFESMTPGDWRRHIQSSLQRGANRKSGFRFYVAAGISAIMFFAMSEAYRLRIWPYDDEPGGGGDSKGNPSGE